MGGKGDGHVYSTPRGAVWLPRPAAWTQRGLRSQEPGTNNLNDCLLT